MQQASGPVVPLHLVGSAPPGTPASTGTAAGGASWAAEGGGGDGVDFGASDCVVEVLAVVVVESREREGQPPV